MLYYKIKYHIYTFFRKIFLKIIYGNKLKIGKGLSVRKDFNIFIDQKGKIEIGDNCFFNNYCSLCSMDKITIGSNTIFGENVKIYDHNHRFNQKDVLIEKQGFKTSPVKIGKNCWIGSNVIILKGVKIGDNSVISAGSIVRENVDSNMIYINGEAKEIEFK